MKSILICEGKTDLYLLSYYLGKVHGWKSTETPENRKKYKSRKNPVLKTTTKEQVQEWYVLNDDILTLFSSDGNSQIENVFQNILTLLNSVGGEPFEKIVILTDRDDEQVEAKLIRNIGQLCSEHSITLHDELCNNRWCSASYENNGDKRTLEILLMIIPFEETGTIETFMLNCMAETECELVERCRKFVDDLCDEEYGIDYVRTRYLNSRGIIPKSKFSTYFSIVSPNRTFDAGDKILKPIPWEKYAEVQETFRLLDGLLPQVND